MSVYIDKSSRVLIQGITGRDGSFHARQMREYGTSAVAGFTPGKGGQEDDGEVPTFDTVAAAVGVPDLSGGGGWVRAELVQSEAD